MEKYSSNTFNNPETTPEVPEHLKPIVGALVNKYGDVKLANPHAEDTNEEVPAEVSVTEMALRCPHARNLDPSGFVGLVTLSHVSAQEQAAEAALPDANS